MDWYKHDIGAYRRATSRLKPLAHGVYRLLMDEYYAGQGPLPDDWTALYRICGAQTEAEKTTVRTVTDQYFPKNGDGFRHNERCDQELADYQTRRATNRGIAHAREAQRIVERSVTRNVSPEAQRFVPTNKQTNIQTKTEGPCSYDENGKKCNTTEGTTLLNNQWICRKHHPYLKP